MTRKKIAQLSSDQIREIGMKALVTALGPTNAARFLVISKVGSGDYTDEKQRWAESVTLEELLEQARNLDANGQLQPPPGAKVIN